MPHAVVALIPAPDELALEHLTAEPGRLLVVATARRPEAACPVCGCASGRVHGRYTRRLVERHEPVGREGGHERGVLPPPRLARSGCAASHAGPRTRWTMR